MQKMSKKQLMRVIEEKERVITILSNYIEQEIGKSVLNDLEMIQRLRETDESLSRRRT